MNTGCLWEYPESLQDKLPNAVEARHEGIKSARVERKGCPASDMRATINKLRPRSKIDHCRLDCLRSDAQLSVQRGEFHALKNLIQRGSATHLVLCVDDQQVEARGGHALGHVKDLGLELVLGWLGGALCDCLGVLVGLSKTHVGAAVRQQHDHDAPAVAARLRVDRRAHRLPRQWKFMA